MARHYGSLINQLIDQDYRDGNITEGVGVTELCWSDRHAYFVKEVKKNKKGEIRALVLEGAWLKAIPGSFGYYEVSREQKEGYFKDHCEITIYKNRKGYFTSDGTVNGTTFRIGKADEYYDPTF